MLRTSQVIEALTKSNCKPAIFFYIIYTKKNAAAFCDSIFMHFTFRNLFLLYVLQSADDHACCTINAGIIA